MSLRDVGNAAQETHSKTGKIKAELAQRCMATKKKSVSLKSWQCNCPGGRLISQEKELL